MGNDPMLIGRLLPLVLSFALLPSAHALSTPSYNAEEVGGLLNKLGITSSHDGRFSLDGSPVDVELHEVDVNNDGQKELLVVLGSAAVYGDTGQGFGLFAKTKATCCKLIFPQTNGMLGFTKGKNKGYRDIIVGGPGFEFPV